MKAYKGFNKHNNGTLWCRGFRYEVGKTYTFDDEPVLCTQGFHACHEPHQCWLFYPNNGYNVYYEVECSGKIIESNNGRGKFVCTEITLIKEIPAPDNKFDWCWNFNDGYARVKLNNKYNFINTDGKYISEQWWDLCYEFYDGYAIVELDGKCNYIDTKGQMISEQWWDSCFDFLRGYARVKLNNKWNYINTNGKLISEQWFDICWSFYDGYVLVSLNNKYNYIDTDGKLISEQWWEDGYSFYHGYARVKLNGKWHEIDKTGKIIEL